MIIREKRLGTFRHSQALKFEERTQTSSFRSAFFIIFAYLHVEVLSTSLANLTDQ